MAITHLAPGFDLNVLQRQGKTQLVANSDRSLTATELFICGTEAAPGLLPIPHITPHPIWPALICDTAQMSEEEGTPWCQILVTYIGMQAGYAGDNVALPEPEEEVISELGEANIESHPRAKEILTEENGANLNAKKKFTGWSTDSPYLGETSWMTPSRIFRRTWSSYTRPTLAEVDRVLGKIDRAYGLMTKFNIVRRGGIFTMTQEWYGAGPKIKSYPVPIYDTL